MKIINRIALLLPAFLMAFSMFSNQGTAQTTNFVTLPFTDNFDGDTVGESDTNFSVSSTFDNLSGYATSNYWQIVSPGIGGSGNGFQSVVTYPYGTIFNCAVVGASTPPLKNIYLSSDFQLQSLNTSGGSFIGLAAFGNVTNIAIIGQTNQGTFIGAYMQITSGTSQGTGGNLLWINFLNGPGNNTGVTSYPQTGNSLTINTNDTYTLTLIGSYDAGTNLMLNVTAKDKNTGASVSSSELISASRIITNYTGNYFGYCNRVNSQDGGAQMILQDNFSLSNTAEVALPFGDSFDNDAVGGGALNFTNSTTYIGGKWQVVTPGIGGSGNGFQSVISNFTSTIYNAAVVQAAVPSPGNFILTSQFQIQSLNLSGNSYMGLAALGNIPNLGIVGQQSGQGTFIWPYMQITGSGEGGLGWVNFLNASGNNSGVTTSAQIGSNLSINTNDVYTYTLVGVYDASSNLTVSLTVQDDTSLAKVSSSEIISAARVATNYTGGYFGYCDRANVNDTGVETILQDNFNLVQMPQSTENLAGWNLTFDDEFSGNRLDTTKWNTTYAQNAGTAAARTIANNNELEVYLDHQFIETNGVLRIITYPTNYLWFGKTYNYASGVIDTYKIFGQTYGYFEMRAKTPPGAPTGDGLWPAFWMLNDSSPFVYPPEIDVLEILDSMQLEPHFGGIQQSGGGAYYAEFYPTFDCSTAFHVFSGEVGTNYLNFYLDGQEVGETTYPTNPPAPLQAIANLAVGGKGTIPPDTNTIFPAFYDIDYIRVWLRTNSAAPVPFACGYDVGVPGLAGTSAVYTNGTATISGAGAGYTSGTTSDSFQFAAQPVAGDLDYDYLIQISSMSVANGQAGVMARQSMVSGAPYTAFYLSGTNCIFQSRTNLGGAAFETATVPSLSPTNNWLRLIRRGTAFTAYQSSDGISWTYVAAVTNNISQTNVPSTLTSVFVGAAVSSGCISLLNTANLNSLNNPAVQVIVDTSMTNGMTATGPWISANVASGGTAGYYGTNYLSDNKTNKGKCFALFTPTLPNTGSYDLYMRWIESNHAATNVPVIVTNASDVTYFTVNQQALGGMWVYEGTYSFNSGTSGNVLITNSTATTGYGVIANAVRLVPGVSTPPAQGDSIMGPGGSGPATVIGVLPNPSLAIHVSPSATNPEFTFQSAPNQSYQLQRTAALVPGNWQNVGPAQTGTGGTLTFTDSVSPSGNMEFYRIQISQ